SVYFSLTRPSLGVISARVRLSLTAPLGPASASRTFLHSGGTWVRSPYPSYYRGLHPSRHPPSPHLFRRRRPEFDARVSRGATRRLDRMRIGHTNHRLRVQPRSWSDFGSSRLFELARFRVLLLFRSCPVLRSSTSSFSYSHLAQLHVACRL